MISPRMMRTPITVVRAQRVTDRYNDEQVSWTNATSVTVRGHVAQRSLVRNAERHLNRDKSAHEAFAYLPPGTAVTALDRITVEGVTYEITGEPAVVKGKYTLCIIRSTKG